MLNLKKIASIDTAVRIGGLGAGSVAANYVQNKLADKVFKTEESKKFAPALPILAGVIISQGKGSLIKAFGEGMIANAAGKVIASIADKDGSIGLGSDVMLSYPVMMNQNTGGNPDLTSTSYDFTSSATGEMDY